MQMRHVFPCHPSNIENRLEAIREVSLKVPVLKIGNPFPGSFLLHWRSQPPKSWDTRKLGYHLLGSWTLIVFTKRLDAGEVQPE